MSKVIITGASRGIGRAIALRFARAGHSLVLIARNTIALLEVVQECKWNGSPSVEVASADITDSVQRCKILDAATSGWNILIHNAGLYSGLPLVETADDELLNLLKVNLIAPFAITRDLLPYKIDSEAGRIIFIGSVSGTDGERNAAAYASTKSALNGLVKSLAMELAVDGTTVNAVCPGWVATEMTQDAVSNEDLKLTVPLARFVQPGEVADLVFYLSSKAAGAITGQCIKICGGLSMG